MFADPVGLAGAHPDPPSARCACPATPNEGNSMSKPTSLPVRDPDTMRPEYDFSGAAST